MPGLLGKKIGMTSVFSADGKNVPCTVIEAGPCVVTQIKSVEKDGYAAVQVGFQDKKEKHTTKPLMGHFKKAGVTPKRHLAEFKDFETELNLGDTITVELFNDAAYVDVVGTSKGKGFQGVVKRHGFGGIRISRKPKRFSICSTTLSEVPTSIFIVYKDGCSLSHLSGETTLPVNQPLQEDPAAISGICRLRTTGSPERERRTDTSFCISSELFVTDR